MQDRVESSRVESSSVGIIIYGKDVLFSPTVFGELTNGARLSVATDVSRTASRGQYEYSAVRHLATTLRDRWMTGCPVSGR